MNRWIITSSLAGALALPLLIAPATASASCNDRKVVGTVAGGAGGALIGNAITHGGVAGTVLGGLGGAVVGHEVARSTCRHESYHEQRSEYHRAPRPSERGYETQQPGAYQGDAQPPPARTVYYDNRGNVIDPVAAPGPAPYANVAYQSACRTETQSYYNDRGELVQYPVQTCAR